MSTVDKTLFAETLEEKYINPMIIEIADKLGIAIFLCILQTI
jgi:hypothetical protein